jgi:hypothetical protein
VKEFFFAVALEAEGFDVAWVVIIVVLGQALPDPGGV